MASANPTTSKITVDEEALDPVLSSIRKVEAIRDFASDITPLRSDGFNLHSWVGEIDKTLSDLIDHERYLRSSAPVVKSEDKIARNLIYWTIPRELRSLINDAPTARDAYKALQAQFWRNTRTCHMAALVDLFNFQMDVTEPQHITMLYDQMYKGMHELVASGFAINEESLLGALFQIAVGRANSQLYTATSQFLDTKFANDQHSISSHEVCAAARRQLEHWHNTIFDEGPMATSDEMIEPHMEEEAHPIPSVNVLHPSVPSSQSAIPATNVLNQQQPFQPSSASDPPQPQPATGSSHTPANHPLVEPNRTVGSSTSPNPAATLSVPPNQAASSKTAEQPAIQPNAKPTDKSISADAATTFGIFSTKPAAPSSTVNPTSFSEHGKPAPSAHPFSSNKADRKHG